jgi:hypothetical protein
MPGIMRRNPPERLDLDQGPDLWARRIAGRAGSSITLIRTIARAINRPGFL